MDKVDRDLTPKYATSASRSRPTWLVDSRSGQITIMAIIVTGDIYSGNYLVGIKLSLAKCSCIGNNRNMFKVQTI